MNLGMQGNHARQPDPSHHEWSRRDTTLVAILIALFALAVFRDITLPGLYMDAVNPDYLAARTINSELKNPVWMMPTAWFQILGNLYYGVQTYYVGIPIYKIFGFSLVSLRLGQALFGVVIVALLYGLSARLTGSRLLAFVAVAGLATDIAFIASFRTQNYIILSGEAWFLAALVLLFRASASPTTLRRSIFLSGVCFGLAVYGYFVFLFFLPAFLCLVIRKDLGDSKTAMKPWMMGFAIGMLPYGIGYLSMVVNLQGGSQAIEFISNTTRTLNPLSSSLSTWGSFTYAFDMARIALSNTGNELMIFGNPIVGQWANARFWFMCFALLFGSVLLVVQPTVDGALGKKRRFLVLLPVSYLLLAGLLGNRLWAHHFSVLIAIAYLLSAIVIADVILFARAALPIFKNAVWKWLVIVCGVLLVTGNLWQQQAFFLRLNETGGVGKFSSALSVMADEAMNQGQNDVYVFPEWGFFMSFAFLTGNLRPYELILSQETLRKYHGRNMKVHLAFWDAKDKEKYAVMLAGTEVKELEFQTYRQKDGKPAFFMLVGKLIH
ncbi:MAG: glycosyltransferase family 39 protein [Betaproteobacteria bacterium]